MRYKVINVVGGKMIFETNDLEEAKLGLTNTSRIIIDTDLVERRKGENVYRVFDVSADEVLS